jgi:hypothetical protein
VARNPLWVAPYWSTRFASLLTISVTNLADGPWREIIAVAVQAPTLAAPRVKPTWVAGLRVRSARSV